MMFAFSNKTWIAAVLLGSLGTDVARSETITKPHELAGFCASYFNRATEVYSSAGEFPKAKIARQKAVKFWNYLVREIEEDAAAKHAALGLRAVNKYVGAPTTAEEKVSRFTSLQRTCNRALFDMGLT